VTFSRLFCALLPPFCLGIASPSLAQDYPTRPIRFITAAAQGGTSDILARTFDEYPTEAPKQPYVAQLLQGTEGPIIAATDYMRTFAEQIRAYVPRRYVVLGTDGYGRSDTREKLRRFFEVDRFHVAVAALKALADEGALPATKVAEAIQKYGIEANRPAPWTV